MAKPSHPTPKKSCKTANCPDELSVLQYESPTKTLTRPTDLTCSRVGQGQMRTHTAAESFHLEPPCPNPLTSASSPPSSLWGTGDKAAHISAQYVGLNYITSSRKFMCSPFHRGDIQSSQDSTFSMITAENSSSLAGSICVSCPIQVTFLLPPELKVPLFGS